MKTPRLRLEALESRDVPASYVVTTTATTGPGSLQAAIDLANANADADIITFAVTGVIDAYADPGGVRPSGPRLLHDVTITGPGADALSIRGPGGIAFGVEADVRVMISGLTVRNASPEGNHGAIQNYGNLTLDHVVVSNITAAGMGAVLSTGTLTVTNCIFRDNRDGYYSNYPLIPSDQRPLGGGAISVRGGSATVTDSLFERNSAFWSGGAINAIGGTLGIDRCTFTGNLAADQIVEGSGYSDFHAGRFGGGALYAERCTITITNSTFSGNTSGVAGGAIQLASGATSTMTNVTIAGNSAQVYNALNQGKVWGGGIGLGSAPAPVLRNTIVAGNILSQSGSPNVPDDYTGTLGTGSVNNLIGANPSGAVGNGSNGNMVGTRTAPIDPLLNLLSDNGGATPTMMPMSGSLAIDRGNNGAAGGLSTDQRGGSFVRVFNGTVDIGAVEVQTAPPPPPPAAGPGAILVGGAPNGTAYVLNQTGGTYSTAGYATFFTGFAGTVRTASADVNGDGTPDYIGGSGPGGGPRVAVIDGATGSRLADFFAFESSFLGGVFVAAGDFDLDGSAEFIVTPDKGGGPRVEIFSLLGGTLTVRSNFFGIDDPAFRGGARAAAGDVNGDGTPDLAVAAGFLGGPRVSLLNGLSVLGTAPTRLIGDFYAFPGEDAIRLRNGVYLAAGDVNGDGNADLAFGGGPGGAPRVFLLSGAMIAAGNVAGAQANPIANFFVAGNSTDRGGVRLAVKDSDADAKADLVVGSGEGSPSNVRVYLGKNFVGSAEPVLFQDLNLFGSAALADGVFVG